MGLQNIEKWIKGKNSFLCMFALDIVSGVDDIYAACQIAGRIDLRERLEDNDFLQKWQNMYTYCAAFLSGAGKIIFEGMNNADTQLINSMINTNEFTQILIDQWKSEIAGMSNKEIFEYIKESNIELELEFKNYLKDLKAKAKPDVHFESNAKNISKDNALLFYFKVWLPCWLEYGEYLPNLMTKATKGDFSALEKLIRIDRFILEHEEIRYQWHKACNINSTIAEDLNNALNNKPLENLTTTNLKYLFGALIYEVFNRTDQAFRSFESEFDFPHPKCKISAEKIYTLFKAYFQDVTKSNTDDDLGTPGAFRTGVTRHKAFWKHSFS